MKHPHLWFIHICGSFFSGVYSSVDHYPGIHRNESERGRQLLEATARSLPIHRDCLVGYPKYSHDMIGVAAAGGGFDHT